MVDGGLDDDIRQDADTVDILVRTTAHPVGDGVFHGGGVGIAVVRLHGAFSVGALADDPHHVVQVVADRHGEYLGSGRALSIKEEDEVFLSYFGLSVSGGEDVGHGSGRLDMDRRSSLRREVPEHIGSLIHFAAGIVPEVYDDFPR